MFYATGNVFSNEIISKYIYGNTGKPADLTDDAVLTRSPNADADVTVANYMAGPGRFASPAFFKLLREFFSLSNSEMLTLIDEYGPDKVVQIDGKILPNNNIDFDEFGNAYIPKNALIYMLEIFSASLNFHQAYFDDGKDDYFQRLFVWGTSEFKISDDAVFVVEGNGGNRRVDNFAIVPRYAKENFDFEGGALSNLLRPIAEPLLDPFGLGSTVIIDIIGSTQTQTYTSSDYENDYANRPISVGGIDYAQQPFPDGTPCSPSAPMAQI